MFEEYTEMGILFLKPEVIFIIDLNNDEKF
jgi:hypothetical protein